MFLCCLFGTQAAIFHYTVYIRGSPGQELDFTTGPDAERLVCGAVLQ